MPGKKLKFPVPSDYAAKHPVVLCPADRVLGLHNQATGTSKKKIAKGVKEWFTTEAQKKGWAVCRFVPQIPSTNGAGAILLNPLSTTVEVHQIIIKFPNADDGD